MQPSTAAIVMIAGAFLADCAWLVWEKRQTKEGSYQGYKGPAGFIPRHHEQSKSVAEILEQLVMTKSVLINVNLNVVGWPITGTIQCEFLPCPSLLPLPPAITLNVFQKGTPVAQRIGTVQFSSPVDPTVTSQMVTVTGSSVAGQNPVVFDAMLPGANFQANDGDVLIETAVAINSAGSSPASPPAYVVVAQGTVPASTTPPPPPPVLPLPPVIGTNTFA